MGDLQDSGNLIIRGNYGNYSDDRIKLNERNLDYGLAQIMALQPKRYARIDWGFDPETEELIFYPERISITNEIGLLAQEVKQVISEAVSIPDDENRQLWTVSYSTIIPVLVKAIQEQQAQIEALQQAKQTLESGASPDTPLTADFDGDGKTDKAMVTARGEWSFWLSASGFGKSGPYNFGVAGKPIASDFDGDGKADPGIVHANGVWTVWLSGSGYARSSI